MERKLIGAILLVLASGCCCTCDHCNDYGPPVLDGPYATQGGRSGSALALGEAPSGVSSQAITPLPASGQ